jgi:hypothetical protein
MMTETDLVADEHRLAGISDLAWWDWFKQQISGCNDPWHDWLGHLRFPHEGPLHNWLESDIEETIKAIDALRLTTSRRPTRSAKRVSNSIIKIWTSAASIVACAT